MKLDNLKYNEEKLLLFLENFCKYLSKNNFFNIACSCPNNYWFFFEQTLFIKGKLVNLLKLFLKKVLTYLKNLLN